MIRALIIDDEFPARENLKILISDFCEGIEVVGTASNISEAKKLIHEIQPQVIFLDIRMPSGAEGFDLLDSFETIDFEVVFVTAFKDYAIQAFKANALDYVMKPVEIEELIETAKRVVAKFKQPHLIQNNKQFVNNALSTIHNKQVERIAISHQKGMKLIEVSDIVHLQASSNYTELKFKDGTKFLDSRTLKTYHELLPSSTFMRVHHSHIVQLKEISEYSTEDGHSVILKNGEMIPVSRVNLPELMKYFSSI